MNEQEAIGERTEWNVDRDLEAFQSRTPLARGGKVAPVGSIFGPRVTNVYTSAETFRGRNNDARRLFSSPLEAVRVNLFYSPAWNIRGLRRSAPRRGGQWSAAKRERRVMNVFNSSTVG